MNENHFLNLTGLSKVLEKLKTIFATIEQGEKAETAFSHSQSAHAPTNAERNVIVGIQKNGNDISPDSSTRKVNITVPTKVSELQNDAGYKTTDTTYETATTTTPGIVKLYTELGSNIDGTLTQEAITNEMNEKADSNHSHNYAGSSSSGGAANSAIALTTSAGSAIQPIYFDNGKPVICTYSLGKSVPEDAVFTDTTYTLSSFGITATANEINQLDGATVTTDELNYLNGVTSNIQTQLDDKSNVNHVHFIDSETEPTNQNVGDIWFKTE